MAQAVLQIELPSNVDAKPHSELSCSFIPTKKIAGKEKSCEQQLVYTNVGQFLARTRTQWGIIIPAYNYASSFDYIWEFADNLHVYEKNIWGGKVAQGFFEARNILKIEDTPDEPVHLL